MPLGMACLTSFAGRSHATPVQRTRESKLDDHYNFPDLLVGLQVAVRVDNVVELEPLDIFGLSTRFKPVEDKPLCGVQPRHVARNLVDEIATEREGFLKDRRKPKGFWLSTETTILDEDTALCHCSGERLKNWPTYGIEYDPYSRRAGNFS